MAQALRLPDTDADGQLYQHVGRYAGRMVLTAFDMIGGVDRLAAWAEKNPGEFFTKVFPKVIAKPHEVGVSEGVENLLERLDEADRADRARPIDAVARVVEEG
jgi:hypothetical protein